MIIYNWIIITTHFIEPGLQMTGGVFYHGGWGIFLLTEVTVTAIGGNNTHHYYKVPLDNKIKYILTSTAEESITNQRRFGKSLVY